jgi:hypothetical protein
MATSAGTPSTPCGKVPSPIPIDRNDQRNVADSESQSVSKSHDGWKRGIRIGGARDGSVIAFIPTRSRRRRRRQHLPRRGRPQRLMRYVRSEGMA